MSGTGLKLAFWIVAAAVAATVLVTPQPVDPWELPSLVLDRSEADAAIELDRVLAEDAPASNEAERLRSLFLDHGRAEANPPYERRDYDRRQVELHHAVEALVELHGESAIGAMRADAVDQFMKALDEGAVEEEAGDWSGIVGGFAEVLERYGAIVDGERVAPELTLRVLYKARWSSVHRRPFTEGFSPIESQAYWGWLALHAWGKDLRQRKDALARFGELDGYGAAEAEALFDVMTGQSARAALALERRYEETGQLRLRNYARGVGQASLSSARAP